MEARTTWNYFRWAHDDALFQTWVRPYTRPGERPYNCCMDSCWEATGSLYKLPHWCPMERWQQNCVCSKLSGGQRYLPVSNLPTVWGGKRDPTLQGALLILECSICCSYMWLTHLARLHRTTVVYSTQKGIQIITPSKELKVWYFSQQSCSQRIICPWLCTIAFLIYESKMTIVSTLRGT